MVAFEALARELEAHPQNVHGWERAICITSGVAMVGTGLRHGGLLGTLRATLGSVVLLRGLTGRCPAKRVIAERQDELLLVKAKLQAAAEQLAALHEAGTKKSK
ncbi:putative membrane protein [Pseudomonas sp. TE3786]